MGFTLLKSSPFSTKALLSTTTKPTTLSRLLPLSSRLLTTAARTHFSFSSLKPILAASGSVQKSEEEWQAILSPEQFRILRQKGTEYPGTGEHDKFFEEGVYHCAGCGAPLCKSTTKFNSGCGWPAFYEGFPGAINRTPDPDGMRIEITCAACGGHLGHVFKGEGFPTPTDERHCVNSISLNLKDHALPCLVTDMDGRDDPILFPLHCCKIIHLLRHAQGIHNVENGDSDEAYLTPKYFDAELTPLGWQQVDNLRRHVCESGISKRIELVIVSPFLRALQTAAGVFGGDDNVDGSGGLPLMVSNSGNSGRPAISSLNCPTFIASELGRGRIGYFTCDKRGNISDYQILFPAIDFSLIESDEDILWKADTEETNEQLTARVQKFIRWLWTRQEKEIAIVTHGLFLKNALVTLGNYSHPSLQSDTQKRFENCELRSFIIVDRSMTGSGPSLGA